MSLESLLQQSIDANNALRNTVDGKVQEINNRVNQAEQQVDSFIAGARKENILLRTSSNQSLLTQTGGAGTAPDGWATVATTTWTHLFDLTSGQPDNQPFQAETDAFFTDVGGRPGYVWFKNGSQAVRAYTVSTADGGKLWEKMDMAGSSTFFAFYVRLKTGRLYDETGSTLRDIDGAELSTGIWTLVFRFSAHGHGYMHVPVFADTNTEFDFFLPATGHGRVAGKDRYWYLPKVTTEYD